MLDRARSVMAPGTRVFPWWLRKRSAREDVRNLGVTLRGRRRPRWKRRGGAGNCRRPWETRYPSRAPRFLPAMGRTGRRRAERSGRCVETRCESTGQLGNQQEPPATETSGEGLGRGNPRELVHEPWQHGAWWNSRSEQMPRGRGKRCPHQQCWGRHGPTARRQGPW